MPALSTVEMTKEIKKIAAEIGFDEVGITRFKGFEEGEKRLQEWIQEGRHGSMKYLEDYEARRNRFLRSFPDAKSVLVLGTNYYARNSQAASGKITGRVARYAWGRDYHKVIRRKHQDLIEKLRELLGESFRAESCVDTKPLLERFAAVRAGLGFVGKNTMLLSRKFGPWLFLSEMVVNQELPEDNPAEGDCGTCVKCQSVCPTGALDEDYRIDARKCIAYLTIEHKGIISKELRPQVKDWVFGCDECLAVCPFTSHQKETRWTELQPSSGVGERLDLDALFSISSNREYEKAYQGTALLRASRKQMMRNACLVLANSGNPEVIPYLEKALGDPALLVRIHAAWGLGRFCSERAVTSLHKRSFVEKDSEVQSEIQAALQAIRESGYPDTRIFLRGVARQRVDRIV